MREIKFRVWNNVLNQMEYDPKMGSISAMEIVSLNNSLAVFKGNLMQYTGLKDKNGKEIFELSEVDNKYRVEYIAPNYILRDIANNDILPLYDNQHTITKDYCPLS